MNSKLTIEENHKKNNLIHMILGMFALTLIFTLMLFIQSNKLMLLIPALYLLYLLIFPNVISHISFTPGNMCFAFSTFLRYFILPLMTLLSDEISYIKGSSIDQKYVLSGEIAYIYEMTIVMFFFVFMKIRQSRKQKNILSDLNSSENSNKMLISKSVVILGLLSVILFPQTLNNYSFAFARQEITEKEVLGIPTLIMLIVDYTRFFIPIILINSYVRNKSQIAFRRTLKYITIIIFIFICIVFYTKTSRNSILLPGLTFMFILVTTFPSEKKRLFGIMGIFLIATATTMTLYKSFYSGSFNFTYITNYVSTYILGPKEFAVGFMAIENYGESVGFTTLLNDIFGNIPFLSNFTNTLNRTGQLYNFQYYSNRVINGGGFIIPSYIQGAFHVGTVFAPIFTLFNIYLFTKLDAIDIRKNSILKTFAITRVAIHASLFFPYNISIMLNIISVWLIPLLILDWLDKRLKLR